MRRSIAVAIAAAALILCGCSNSSSPPISVSLSPSTPQVIYQGQSVFIVAAVTNDSLIPKGVRWSLNGPGSLSNSNSMEVTYNSSGTSFTSAEQVTVTATSVADAAQSASLAVTVNPNLAIPINGTASPMLPNGIVGTPYSQALELAGGIGPFHWSIYNGPSGGDDVGGALPDGLTLDSSTGTISGTPTAPGTWYLDVTVNDAQGGVFGAFLSIQINPAGPTGANPVPFLNQRLAPAAVAPGGSALTLKVSGANFTSGATVHWNGAPLTTTFLDSEHLSALVPAANVATAQTASVTIVNPAPGGGSSNTAYFQVGAPEAAPRFVNAPTSPLQMIQPFGLAVADFNQDGKPDLAVADGGAGLDALLGNGDGTFTVAPGSPERIQAPPFGPFPLLPTPYIGPMALGDFTDSGHLGLAAAEFDTEGVEIFLGNGNGTFDPSSAVFANAEGMYTTGLAAADFNADGDLDLAIINSPSGQLAFVALGYGSGAFNMAGGLYNPGFPVGVAVGDFNGDGKLDAAVASEGSTKSPDSGVAISLGKGDGTFTQANGSPIFLGQSLSAIVAADFNGDGKLDLAVTDSGANAVYILLGNGDGTFQSPIKIAVGSNPQAITIGDFNNDGKLDLAVANDGDNSVTLLLGNGDGTFTEASNSPYIVGKGPFAIAAADFNGDGKLDIAVANGGDGTVSVLLQQ
ncbi:MAG: FG-GAP-like repeat-containing protein [Acidobacteriota bacterium]